MTAPPPGHGPPPTADPFADVARLYRAWAILRPEWVRDPPPPHRDGRPASEVASAAAADPATAAADPARPDPPTEP